MMMVMVVVTLAVLIVSVQGYGGVDVVEEGCGPCDGVDVVVVGGGVAGMTAVKTLLHHNITNLVLLEAQDYLGGRVKTFRQGGVLVEDGAEWVHGDTRNPLHRLAAALTAIEPILQDEAWDWRVLTETGAEAGEELYHLAQSILSKALENGVLIPYYGSGYGQFYKDRLREAGHDGVEFRSLRHFIEQMVNYNIGTGTWDDIAARDADQHVEYGEDYQWKNGYDTLITHLQAGIPDSVVRLSSAVSRIYWDNRKDEDRVLVETSGGIVFRTQYVIFTASVGYLKEQHQHIFEPPLPQSFITTLAGVELGVVNKVHLGWITPWWGNKSLDLNIFRTNLNLPNEMLWLQDVTLVRSVHRQPAVLQIFVTGDRSLTMEELPEQQVREHVLYLLTKVTGQLVPQPTFFRRTQWSRNPWMRGSYSSFITVEGDRAGLHSRSQLSEPLCNSRNKVMVAWAGEHTHNTRFSTVDGAMETGRREGDRLANLLKPSKSPMRTLDLDSLFQ